VKKRRGRPRKEQAEKKQPLLTKEERLLAIQDGDAALEKFFGGRNLNEISAMILAQSYKVAKGEDGKGADARNLAVIAQIVMKMAQQKSIREAELRKYRAQNEIIFEKAKKAALENEISRGDLISISALRGVISIINKVHASELHMLGGKLATAICGMLDAPASQVIKVKALLDAETFRTSARIKRELGKWVENFGGGNECA